MERGVLFGPGPLRPSVNAFVILFQSVPGYVHGSPSHPVGLVAKRIVFRSLLAVRSSLVARLLPVRAARGKKGQKESERRGCRSWQF